MPKVTIKIDTDEWWPVYLVSSATDNYGRVCDVDSETLEKWNAMFKQFEAVQEEMGKIYKAAPEVQRV